MLGSAVIPSKRGAPTGAVRLYGVGFWLSLLAEHEHEHVSQSGVFHKSGDVVFRHVCTAGFEGIVSKRLGSRYRSGLSYDWLKVRCPAYEATLAERQEKWNG